MKVIDLLNKIANKEEVPKKIKWAGDIYERHKDNEIDYYENVDASDLLLDNLYSTEELNDEIEIIEEDNKIEKLDYIDYCDIINDCDNWLRYKGEAISHSNLELNPYIIQSIRDNTIKFQNKIDDIVDEINKLKEDK